MTMYPLSVHSGVKWGQSTISSHIPSKVEVGVSAIGGYPFQLGLDDGCQLLGFGELLS